MARFPATSVTVGAQVMQFRAAGNRHIAPTHVLLHGIGSGSASWVHQLQAVHNAQHQHVLAWDAPGYANSSLLPMVAPQAADYTARLWQWLDSMAAPQPITLVGHSLGCLIAAHAARQAPHRVKRLVLLAPAQGYGSASVEERNKKLQDRLETLATLGPQGLAHKRGSAMLSANASAEQIAFVQAVMAQMVPAGYTQAARLLAQGDLRADLSHVSCPVQVASGSADGITPVAGCMALAAAVHAPYLSLGVVGHVCALEAAQAVSQMLGLGDPA